MHDPNLKARIENDFTYHPPKEGQPEKYEALRAQEKELAQLFESTVPHGRELSIALTHLEIAMMFANAGIARHG